MNDVPSFRAVVTYGAMVDLSCLLQVERDMLPLHARYLMMRLTTRIESRTDWPKKVLADLSIITTTYAEFISRW